MSKAYINFKKYSVEFDTEKKCGLITHDDVGVLVNGLSVDAYDGSGQSIDLSASKCVGIPKHKETASELTLIFSDNEKKIFEIRFRIDETGVSMHGDQTFPSKTVFTGSLHVGTHDRKSEIACAINRDGSDLCTAYGPATSCADNSVFDRESDRAVVFSGDTENLRIIFCRETEEYNFKYDFVGVDPKKAVVLELRKNVYKKIFNSDYRCLKENSTFPKVPVGWMTWYALQFSADEKKIIDNLNWQKEHLYEYGANALWVDAEWRQRDNSGLGRNGMDNYHPNIENYPHGLKYLADKIKDAGFVPAIWMSPTVETRENSFIKGCPEIVSMKKTSWCGRYWMDCSHPEFLDKALKKMISLIKDEWGFKAIKWDVMSETIIHTDEMHDSLYDNEKSTREIILNMFAKAREYTGTDFPLLACFASGDRDLDMFLTSFDYARIGGDIFTWNHFLEMVIKPLYSYYSYHRIVCNNDPDNVVLRPEFSTYDQAVTRAVIPSMLGLPYTMGDDLTELPEDRVNIIKRTIPPLDVIPKDIRQAENNTGKMIINSFIEKSFESYLVNSVSNLTDETCTFEINIYSDLHLDEYDGGYHIFEYWSHRYYGKVKESFNVSLRPFETKVFTVRKSEKNPQLISTSRHISQGADDVIEVGYDEETKMLSGKSKVIGGEPYSVTFTCGDGSEKIAFEYINEILTTSDNRPVAEGIWTATFHPTESGILEWRIPFTRFGGMFGKYHEWD